MHSQVSSKSTAHVQAETMQNCWCRSLSTVLDRHSSGAPGGLPIPITLQQRMQQALTAELAVRSNPNSHPPAGSAPQPLTSSTGMESLAISRTLVPSSTRLSAQEVLSIGLLGKQHLLHMHLALAGTHYHSHHCVVINIVLSS